MPFLLLLLLLQGGPQAGRLPAPWIHSLGYRPEELFPITVGRHGFPYLPALINGRKVDLLVDTANMTGLFMHPDLAARLGLPASGYWTRLEADGSEVGRYRVFQVAELTVFGEVWKDERARERTEAGLEGAIGPRFLRGKRFTLDYRNGLMAVSQSPLPEPAAVGETFPLSAAEDYEGMILVRGAVNGRPVLIQLDTGKSRTCVDPRLASALRLPKTADGYRVDEIRLGSFSFVVPSAKEVSFKGISKGLPEPILLGIGSDILSRVVLTVDYPGKRIVLSKVEPSSSLRSPAGSPPRASFARGGSEASRLVVN